jgi:hypothetical protein
VKLRTALTLSVAGTLAVALIVATWIFTSGLARYSQDTALAAVETRANALASFVSRALFEEWQRVEQRASRVVPGDTADALQSAVDSLATDDQKTSWVGIARADGTVVAAARGLLVGENVASRPWFSEGLKGPFAGDVHEAVLLARLLNPEGDDPLRFIDFAAPIRNADGTVWGVLGTHVNWRWVRELVQQAASELALETFIVNAAGTVILSTGPTSEEIQDLAIFRSAALGSPGTSDETWPDGRSYYAATMSERSYETLPPFGWRYIMRLDPQFVFGAADAFRAQMLIGMGLTLVGAFLLLALIIGFFTQPLGVLLDSLMRLARGESVGYHRDRTRYRELGTLSEAIARLQSQPVERLPDGARNDATD